jgi:hypothetical protein
MKPTAVSSLSLTLPAHAVTAPYRPLHKHLVDRYAETVVLTFAEIDDLLGGGLPDVARLQADWWADVNADGSVSPQSQSWTAARRSSTPNLLARKVTFKTVM